MNLKPHPLSRIFPEMSHLEFDQLKQDISKHGLRDPIVLFDGKVLDGRHRAKACHDLGVTPRTRVLRNGSPLAFVISMNLKRRHLTVSQRALIGVDVEREYSKLISKGRPKKSEKNHGLSGEAREHAAKELGITATYITDAKAITAKDPELARLVRSGAVTLSKAKRQLKREENRKKAAKTPPPNPTKLVAAQTIVIDPPWDVRDEGDENQMGRANPDYTTMTIKQIAKLPVARLADKNCHLYLWITNRSLPKGFALLDAWGFRYITTLTWCKPSIGVGNYFRNNTEHVLFGVKGKLGLLRQDVGTWFEAKRGKGHSTKPSEFYKLVESCSPGPRLEMFARGQRSGWMLWGADA